MEPTRDEIRAWIESILEENDETASALAERAGVYSTTLTRFMNSDSVSMLSLRTIAKIAHATGRDAPGLPHKAPAPKPTGIAEGEAEPYKVEPEKGPIDTAISALLAGRNAADPWRLNTRAIEALGYLPGDIVIVDLNATPEPGDVVCTQVYEWSQGKAETVFRVYEPPYLVAAPADPALARQLRKPLLVDNDRVIIKGVVTEVFRRARS